MPTVTLAILQSKIHNNLDDNTQFYTTAEVTSAINEAIRVLNLHTGFLQTEQQLVGHSQAGRIIYDVPSGILFPLRVKFERRYLNKVPLVKMGQFRAKWMTDTTSNSDMPVSSWVPIGISKFAIHPADSLGGGSIRVTGVAEPTLLSASTDVISYPNEIADILEEYATMILQLKADATAFRQAQVWLQKFYRKIKDLSMYQTYKNPQYFIEASAPLAPSA